MTLTVDHSLLYINGRWDAHLTYVAMTRHRHSCNIYLSRQAYSTFEKLADKLGQSAAKDSTLDYPMGFARRRGLDVEWLWSRLMGHVRAHIRRLKAFWQKPSQPTTSVDVREQWAVNYGQCYLRYETSIDDVVISHHRKEVVDTHEQLRHELLALAKNAPTVKGGEQPPSVVSVKEALAQAHRGSVTQEAYRCLAAHAQQWLKRTGKQQHQQHL